MLYESNHTGKTYYYTLASSIVFIFGRKYIICVLDKPHQPGLSMLVPDTPWRCVGRMRKPLVWIGNTRLMNVFLLEPVTCSCWWGDEEESPSSQNSWASALPSALCVAASYIMGRLWEFEDDNQILLLMGSCTFKNVMLVWRQIICFDAFPYRSKIVELFAFIFIHVTESTSSRLN